MYYVFNEIGQCSAELLATFDLILRKVGNSNICFGGLLIIVSINCTQIQPICGRPFLKSCHVIPCVKVVTIKLFIRAVNDVTFKLIQ